jgi:hypothetical protein
MRNNWTIHIEGLQGDLMLLIACEDIVESSRAEATDHITVKLVSNRNSIKQNLVLYEYSSRQENLERKVT